MADINMMILLLSLDIIDIDNIGQLMITLSWQIDNITIIVIFIFATLRFSFRYATLSSSFIIITIAAASP